MFIFVISLLLIFIYIIGYRIGLKNGKNFPCSVKIIHTKTNNHSSNSKHIIGTVIYLNNSIAEFNELVIHNEENRIIIEAEDIRIAQEEKIDLLRKHY